ncbi:hypothetical protein [Streptomyces sp. STR69]|uniref:hypothetical protein n=1 Tax=Streptomyces sp. STR69 TaxID=1796942 RepID=UPI0021CA276F|nr:hypothetical protein [Streptomyces sp. STR69]
MPNDTPPPSRPPLLREQHRALPLEPHADVGEPARYRRAGGGFVSVNVGYAPHGADDIDDAVRAGRVAVAFDLEDSGPLEGDLDRYSTSTTSVCAPCCRAEDAVAAILGGAFRQVAAQVWR